MANYEAKNTPEGDVIEHKVVNATKVYNRISYGVMMLLVLAVFGGLAVFNIAESEYKRDVHNWDIRLGITADFRADAVQKWVRQYFAEMEDVANNVGLQLYVTEMTTPADETLTPAQKAEQESENAAQFTYQRNYLEATAMRTGFMGGNASRVNANVDRPSGTGIAVVDMQGKVLVASAGMPAVEGQILQFLQNAPRGQKTLMDIFIGENGVPMIGFLAPIFPVQGDPTAEEQIGAVLGIRRVDNSLYPLLDLPKGIEQTAETILVRKITGQGDDMVQYISPLLNGIKPLDLKLSINNSDLSAAYALLNPGLFGMKKDYAGDDVLLVSRTIPDTPWTLIHKITSKEALQESEQRRTGILSIAGLVIVALVLVIIGVWRHGSSVRSAQAAERYKQLAEKFRSQGTLLRLVTDNQPDAMFILDNDNKYRFANLEAARHLDVSNDDLIGKTFQSVVGPDKASKYETVNNVALEEVKSHTQVQKVKEPDGTQLVIQSRHIPLRQIPDILTDQITAGVLVVEQDITQAISEREKRERILRQIVETLVSIVDMRDPYSADHSARVAQVAEAISREMNLTEVDIDTARIAGNLMNLGKLLLPTELLTKKGKLTDGERMLIMNSQEATLHVLENIEFDGPVVETLRQSNENWDGTGKLGLKGEEIITPARVIALANAFVAMISPRAYRPSMQRDEVIKIFMDEMDKKYQRRVVVALLNYIENNDSILNIDPGKLVMAGESSY